MILWALTAIFVLFVLFAFVRKNIHKISGIRICSICAAVGVTWLALLILKIAGMDISNLLLGILMGESITSVMYMFENKAKKEGKNKMLWLKVVIILTGTLLVYLLLTQGFSPGAVIVLVISAIFAVLIYGMLKSKKSRKIINKRYSRFGKDIRKLEKRLEHCCD